MDLDGEWKPPQEWPESTPPLPGWTRNADGLWTNQEIEEVQAAATTEDAARADVNIDLTALEADLIDPFEADRANALAAVEAVSKPTVGLGLSYSTDAVATPHDLSNAAPNHSRSAVLAAVGAATIACMLGAGIVLLILL